jgi:DNA-binding IclR family transcriptional regulator
MDDGADLKIPRDYVIGVVDKAIQILFALGLPEYIQLSLKELSESLEISKNNTFRILHTLQRRQLVEEINGKWQIAPALTRFSVAFKRHMTNRHEELARLWKDHTGSIETAEGENDGDKG